MVIVALATLYRSSVIEENQDYLEEGLNLKSISSVVLVVKIQGNNKQLILPMKHIYFIIIKTEYSRPCHNHLTSNN